MGMARLSRCNAAMAEDHIGLESDELLRAQLLLPGSGRRVASIDVDIAALQPSKLL
jgi:hypothetical protein